MYLKANIYIIAIFLCDIQFVDKKLIYFGIFFCNILQFFSLLSHREPTLLFVNCTRKLNVI